MPHETKYALAAAKQPLTSIIAALFAMFWLVNFAFAAPSVAKDSAVKPTADPNSALLSAPPMARPNTYGISGTKPNTQNAQNVTKPIIAGLSFSSGGINPSSSTSIKSKKRFLYFANVPITCVASSSVIPRAM